MQYGLFTMPSHPPECSLFDGHRWDLQTLRWADELGFTEGWIGELYDSAVKQATDEERAMAGEFLMRWMNGRRD